MDFYRKMALVCRRIPEGKVATYGQIALLCRKPGNSRQVGYGLKKGLAGEGVPAHRVVNSRGILSGAAYFDTMDMQRLLLEREGVEVIRGHKGFQVDLKKYKWEHTEREWMDLGEAFQREDTCGSGEDSL